MTYRVLIAPNAFRGSLDTFQVAEAIKKGLQKAGQEFFDIQTLPVADGGDHTADVLVHALGGRFETASVSDPLGRQLEAQFGLLPNRVAVIELAKASGTGLLQPGELDPMQASTFGTGQLIKAALDKGCRKIIIGLGGSATVDGGAGLLQALGIELLDENDRPVGRGGGALKNIRRIVTDRMEPRLKDCELIIACDVENLLTGHNGAARVFAPQKGASPEQVEELEQALQHFGNLLTAHHRAATRQTTDVNTLIHGGAAGGTAAALFAVLNASLTGGADLLLDLLDFDRHVQQSDMVITAEGKLDSQTTGGKAPYAVALRAKAAGKTVLALAGQLAEGGAQPSVFDAAFSIIHKPMTLQEAISRAPRLLEDTAQQIGGLVMGMLKSQNKFAANL